LVFAFAAQVHLHLYVASIPTSLLFGCPQSLMQRVAFQRLLASLDFPERFEVPPQTSLPHRTLLEDPRPALSQNVSLISLRQQFQPHRGARRLPTLPQQRFFKLTEASLGCPNQIRHRRAAFAHFLENFLGRNATVHDPDAVRFSVLALDFLQEPSEGAAVGCVTGKHLVGHRETFRCHNQRNDHLHAVAALIAEIPIKTQVFRIFRRRTLKIGASQIVQKHLVFGGEEHPPALGEMVEKRLSMYENFVVAFIESVDFRQSEVSPKRSARALC
jgi:hypothetical protein